MFIWSKSSACRVFPSARQGLEDGVSLALHSGRNMTVSGQVILREFGPFTITGVEITAAGGGKLPDGISAEWNFVKCVTFNDGVPYPDVLSHDATVEVKAHTAQSIWITLRVAPEAAVGVVGLDVIVHAGHADFKVTWTLTVHAVTLPEPCDSTFGHEYFFTYTDGFPKGEGSAPAPVTPFYDIRRYSDEWWDLMAVFARTMKDLRANSLNLTALTLLADGGSRRTGADSWELKFELLDRFVEHFMKHGSFRDLTVGAIIAAVNGGSITSINEQGGFMQLTLPSSEADAWGKAYYGGLYKHFEEKGWLPMMRMRLQDEPHSSEYWKWGRAMCRQYMPGVPCGEPIDTHSVGRELAGECDQYVPRLEVYEEGADYYTARQTAGDEVWCYSCCYPEDPWWLNRFIDQPHVYPRLIKWACFSQGITGFLHWGFNYWGGEMYGMYPNTRFKGDGYIVYPDPAHNNLCLSVRGAATREGIQEWELLRLLAEKDPATAKAISRRVARSFRDFTTDETVLDHAREQILSLLD